MLRYSVQTAFPQPLLDLAQAIATIRQQADEWYIDPDRITLCGFSAGGHLCASLGVMWDKPLLYERLGVSPAAIKPNALILGYPLIDLTLMTPVDVRTLGLDQEINTDELVRLMVLGDRHPPQAAVDQYCADPHVSVATPPTFLWHTADDEDVPARNSLLFATALAGQGIPYELHIFAKGGHGLALADETTQAQDRYLNPACQIWMDLAIRWLQRQGG